MKRYLKCAREYCTDSECQNSAPIISDIAALLDFGWCQFPFSLANYFGVVLQTDYGTVGL